MDYTKQDILEHNPSTTHHDISEPFEEHGGVFAVCRDCGASWSIHDAVSTKGEEYPQADQIDDGDGYCEESRIYV